MQKPENGNNWINIYPLQHGSRRQPPKVRRFSANISNWLEYATHHCSTWIRRNVFCCPSLNWMLCKNKQPAIQLSNYPAINKARNKPNSSPNIDIQYCWKKQKTAVQHMNSSHCPTRINCHRAVNPLNQLSTKPNSHLAKFPPAISLPSWFLLRRLFFILGFQEQTFGILFCNFFMLQYF